jgi:hypothetical protein
VQEESEFFSTKRRAKSNAGALWAIALEPKHLNAIISFQSKARAIFSSVSKNRANPSPTLRSESRISDQLAHPDQVVKALYQVVGIS